METAYVGLSVPVRNAARGVGGGITMNVKALEPGLKTHHIISYTIHIFNLNRMELFALMRMIPEFLYIMQPFSVPKILLITMNCCKPLMLQCLSREPTGVQKTKDN